MKTQAVENLKSWMAERVSNDFDPLKMTTATLDCMDLLAMLPDTDANKPARERIASLYGFAKNIFNTGNIACNLNIILQNQNLALLQETKELKLEIEQLNKTIEWEKE